MLSSFHADLKGSFFYHFIAKNKQYINNNSIIFSFDFNKRVWKS